MLMAIFALSLSMMLATTDPDHAGPCSAASAMTARSSVTKMIRSSSMRAPATPSFSSIAGAYSDARANVHVFASKSIALRRPPVS